MAYSKMETTYSHDRFYVLPREIRGIKIPGTGTKDTLPQEGFFKLPEAAQKKILYQLEVECNYVVPGFEEWKKNAAPELCRVILQLSYLYSKYPKGLVELLTEAAWDTESYYPKAKLVFDAVNEESASMAKKLFPQAERVPSYEAEW